MKKRRLVRIREFDDSYLHDSSKMIQFSSFFKSKNLIFKGENDRYELVDFYCKNKNCDCTDVNFAIMVNGQDINETLSYDYEKRQLNEPSKYGFLLDMDGKDDLEVDGLHDMFKNKHDLIRIEFENFRLRRKAEGLEAEIERLKEEYYEENPSQKTQRNDNKIGRNDPCPCGSGKKYKRCCLKS